MYPRFAREAEQAGIPAAALTFRYAGEAELGHERLFEEALQQLGRNPPTDYFVESESGRVRAERPGHVATVTGAAEG